MSDSGRGSAGRKRFPIRPGAEHGSLFLTRPRRPGCSSGLALGRQKVGVAAIWGCARFVPVPGSDRSSSRVGVSVGLDCVFDPNLNVPDVAGRQEGLGVARSAHRPRRVFAVGDQHRMVTTPASWPRQIPFPRCLCRRRRQRHRRCSDRFGRLPVCSAACGGGTNRE